VQTNLFPQTENLSVGFWGIAAAFYELNAHRTWRLHALYISDDEFYSQKLLSALSPPKKNKAIPS